MSLFNLFMGQKKLDKPTVTFPVCLGAGARGMIVPMSELPDPVFSGGVLGPACGIEPAEGRVYAPVDGKISSLTGSKHAIGIEGEGGIEILIHVGVDTVCMKGDGFTNLVKQGDTIKKGQMILTMDLDKIKKANYSAVVMMAVTNSDDFSGVELVASGTVEPGMDLLKISK